MEKIINNLYLHTVESMKQKDMDVVITNLDMFLDIYKKILEVSSNYERSELLKQWIKYTNFLGSKAIEDKIFDELIDLIDKVYTLSVEYEINVDLDETIEKLINVFRDSNSYVELNNLPIKKMLRSIYLNAKEELFPKYVRLYFSILKNKSLSDEEKVTMVTGIIMDGLYFQYEEPSKRENKKMDVLLIALYTSKYMIDNEDYNGFVSLLDKLKGSLLFDEFNLKIYLYMGCYLYYLGYKEKLARGKNYKQFFKNYHFKFIDEELIFSDFWANYEEVKILLGRFEWFPPGEAKMLIMDDVVREYFIFLSLAVGRSNFINHIKRDELFAFLDSNLNEEGNFKAETEENYKIFKEDIMGLRVEDNLPELESLIYKLTTRFREIKYEEYNTLKNQVDIIENNIKVIRNRIATKIGENPIFNRINIDDESNSFTKVNTEYKMEKLYDLSFFATHKMNLSIVDNVFYRHFEQFIFKQITDNNIKTLQVDYRKDNKLDILFDIIKSSSTELNSLISGIRDTQLFYENEINKMSFQKLSETITFTNVSVPVWFAYNNKEFSIRIKNIDVKISLLEEEQIKPILEKYKIAQDLFKLNLTNNIYTFVNEKEAVEYIKQTQRLFSIIIDIEIIFKDTNSGFLVISGKTGN